MSYDVAIMPDNVKFHNHFIIIHNIVQQFYTNMKDMNFKNLFIQDNYEQIQEYYDNNKPIKEYKDIIKDYCIKFKFYNHDIKLYNELMKKFYNLIKEYKELFIKNNIEQYYDLFKCSILYKLQLCFIAYIESMIILKMENKNPKFIKVLNKGTYNYVLLISLNNVNCVLRLSTNSISKTSLADEKDFYKNMLYFNNSQLKKFLIKYPNIQDSSNYKHTVKNNCYFTHWSISKLYKTFNNIKSLDKYKYKYIITIKQLLQYFDKSDIYYYDWKLHNFGIDENDNLVLLDIDFESCFTNMNICSTHRLTPDPSELKIFKYNLKYSDYKKYLAKILMYVSAYLSMISIYASTSLNDYNITFTHVSFNYKFINDNDTVNCMIRYLSDNKFITIPNKLKQLKELYKIVKNKIIMFDYTKISKLINDDKRK